MIIKPLTQNSVSKKNYVKAEIKDIGQKYDVKFKASIFEQETTTTTGITIKAHYANYFENESYIFQVNSKTDLKLTEGFNKTLEVKAFNNNAYFSVEQTQAEKSDDDAIFSDTEFKEKYQNTFFKVGLIAIKEQIIFGKDKKPKIDASTGKKMTDINKKTLWFKTCEKIDGNYYIFQKNMNQSDFIWLNAQVGDVLPAVYKLTRNIHTNTYNFNLELKLDEITYKAQQALPKTAEVFETEPIVDLSKEPAKETADWTVGL